jgi:spore maturation protein A
MNYLWAGMMLMGIVYGAFTGRLDAVTEAALESAREAVDLCVYMAGIMGFWVGFMEIARNAGLIEQLTKKFARVINFLFPDIPKGHKAREFIAANMIANVLGLGWAATPAGLSAMVELEKLEEERRVSNLHVASDEMCTFLVLNISSLQLIPVNIIAYRSQYGSVSPTAVVGPGIVATAVSTVVAVVFCKVMSRRKSSVKKHHVKYY